jgi:hypothetical protein
MRRASACSDAGLVVAPDIGGHGEDALSDTDGDALEGPSAVLLQVQLPLEGVVHGLDQLSHRFEQAIALGPLLPLQRGPQQVGGSACC